MAKAKAARARGKADKPIVEEVYFRSDSAYLCLVINRRARFIRVVDFRAGALPAKRLYIQSVAKQEGIEKVITLVEKDEVSSWTRVGFVREGTIPGFYKRSDGHLCGCVINDKTASIEVSDDGVKLTERTINNAKKVSKDVPDAIKGAVVEEIDADVALAARDSHWKKDSGLSAFDPFGRDAERIFVEVTYKRSKPSYVSAEYEDCFGHTLIETLRSPKDTNEMIATVAGLRALGDRLTEAGLVSAFAFTPNDDEAAAGAYLAAGYRKTGLLAQGFGFGDQRKDAILWTRKLANPGDDDDSDSDDGEEE